MYLYAELLLHIRTVTVFAKLADLPTTQTTGRLSEDRCSFTVQHHGQATKIRLPSRVASSVPLEQQIPQNPSTELSFRLPLEKESPNSHRSLADQDALAPWSASTLKPFECMHCSICRRDIVKPSTIYTWKDLPSENWAEMMDFWHCHKPHVDSNRNSSSSNKGYSAANRLTAQRRVGFVDTATFVLAEQDCSSIRVTNTTSVKNSRPDLACEGCNTIIGISDDLVSGLRLFKSRVSLGFKGATQLEQYPSELWLATLLLSASEAQSTKKLIVHDRETQAGGYLIWLFTPDLWISTSEPPFNHEEVVEYGPRRAMKILWKRCSAGERASQTESNLDDDVNLSSEDFNCLEDAMTRNQSFLPLSARQYHDWTVSFLHRFPPKDINGSKS